MLKSALVNLLLASPVAAPRALNRIQRFLWLARFRAWQKANPCPDHPDRESFYAALADQEGLADEPIDYLEFGVWQGRSIRWWMRRNAHPDSRFVGFDTFEGLPEQWEFGGKGQFSTGGETPPTDDPRCRFVKGLFQDTLAEDLREHRPMRRKVINLDADLYSATLFVMIQLAPLLREGDILIFDEFMSYEHEFRAWMGFLEAYPISARLLRRQWSWCQVAFRVEGDRAVFG